MSMRKIRKAKPTKRTGLRRGLKRNSRTIRKPKLLKCRKSKKGRAKAKENAFELRRQNQNLANLRKLKHVAYSAVRHTACQQIKFGSSAQRVDDGHMMIVQVLTMMMHILFVIYVRRPNHCP